MKFALLKKENIHKGFLTLEQRTVEYEKFNAEMSGKLLREVVVKNSAVAAVVFHTEWKEYLLVRQFRAPLADRDNPWLDELVAGHIDAGETSEEAVCREIEEEMGYRPVEVEKLRTFFTSPGYSNEKIILFSCRVDETMKIASGGGVHAEGEDILVKRFSEDKIKYLLTTGKIQDAKTIIGLQLCLYK